MRRWSLGVVASLFSFVVTVVVGAAVRTAHSTPMSPGKAIVHAARPATSLVVRRSNGEPEASLEIDEPRFVRHVESIAKLIGHPASELEDQLGSAAKVGDGIVEWDVADVGIAAGTTYALATVDNGKVTTVMFRGRSTEEILHRLRSQLSLQLTMAGGERPSFTIVGGE